MSESRPEARTKHNHHIHKETHGLRDDLDDTTPLDDVRAPTVFERAKEEIQAIVHAIHPIPNKESQTSVREESEDGKQKQKPNSGSESDRKTSKLIEKAKERVEKRIHHSPGHRHHKETHGHAIIDETMPIDEVKAPNIFERAKEEIEAVFQAIHPRKDH